jgi:hypothetical protein
MFFDLIGKLFFPHQPDWLRQRNARIMTYVVLASVVCGVMLVAVFRLMNARH